MLKGLGPYVRRHAWRWEISAAASVVAVASSLWVPRAIGAAIDDLRTGTPRGGHLVRYALTLLVAAVVSGAMFVVTRRFAGGASRRVAYEVRRDIFARLTELDAGYYHRTRTGDLMNKLTGDLGAVQEMLGFGITQGATTALTLAMVLGSMCTLSLRLGLLVLGVFPLVAGLLAVLLRVMARRYARAQEQQSRVAARAQENFSGIRVVKGYAMEDREVLEYRGLMEEHRRRVLALARVEGPLWATVGFLMNLVFAAVLLLGARELLRAGPSGTVGGLTLGRFVTFTSYLFQLAWPVLAVGMTANSLQRGAVSWDRLREVLDEVPAVADQANTDHGIRDVRGEVAFEGVTLKRDGRTLLADIDLAIPAGRVIGVTGPTGAGKTLLGALVARLYDPTAGYVRIDGRDAREVPLAVLRGHLGVVPQEPFLFSDTIAENIAFGVAGGTAPDDATVRWAARVAGLAGDIEAFPQGYATVLGERGVTLSGGQRQRTALARALARRPAILVLDDALSAVDTETEAAILSGLRGAVAGTTVVLIGHRVSTLRHADEIVVLEHGRIVERGTHDGLVTRGGRYAALELKQRLASELAAADSRADAPPAEIILGGEA